MHLPEKGQILLLRADADARTGTGHVMRCLALGQAWCDAAFPDVATRAPAAVLLAAHLPAVLAARCEEEGLRVRDLPAARDSDEDAEETLRVAEAVGASWVVLDGYHLGDTHQRRLRDGGFRVLAFDDYGHAVHRCADMVLNQNLGADAALYGSRGRETGLLLGPAYVQLRRNFRAALGARHEVPERASRVLVTLGGSDPDNATVNVIKALCQAQIPDLEAVAVVGAGSPHRAAVEAAAGESDGRVRVECDVRDMASLMAWSDLAVTAGGTTCWELAAMGVPFLVMILADNQVRGATAAVAQGMAVSLGWHRELSTAQLAAAVQGLAGDRQARDRLAARGRETVDGYGGTRVLHAMGVLPLGWRPTEPGDKRRVWEWANDPVARRASFRSDPIAWETHDAWFDRRLQNPNGLFMIAMLGDVPVGQARLDVCGQQGEISLCLRREFRGMGLGVEFIGSAGKAFFQARADARSITARVREDNAVSQRSFERAGYHRHGREEVLGHAAVVYELARQEAM